MEWPAVDEVPLPTSPLIVNQGLFTIEANDVEHRNGRYILQQDEAMSLACNSSDLTVREIRPSAGTEYRRDEQGCVVFDGTALSGKGDRYGALEIGMYVPNLDYPIGVLRFELTAPLSVSGEVQLRGDDLRIHRFQSRNEPPAESNHYPYRFEYNITTDDGETAWHDLSLTIGHPDDFRKTPSLDPAPDEITAAFSKGSPVRIRLRSARGDTCGFRAICKRREIIRFSEPQPPVPIINWIGRPNTLNIEHDRYRFDIDSMEESWQRYPQLLFDSAIEWLEFEPLCIDIEPISLHLLEDGHHLELSAKLDFSAAPQLIEFSEELLNHILITINGKKYSLVGSETIHLHEDNSIIDFVLRLGTPKSRRRLPKTFNLPARWEIVDNGSVNVFEKTAWNLRLSKSYRAKPQGQLVETQILGWRDAFIHREDDSLSSRVHPSLMRLFKCEFRRSTSIFCGGEWRGRACGSMGYLAPNGDFRCYRCGWTNDSEVLGNYIEVETSWLSNLRKAEQEMYRFEVREDQLEAGTYALYFNGMSFRFEVR